MGHSKEYDEKVALTTKTEELIRKAGYQIIYPENLDNLCCGMAFSSKGFKDSAALKVTELQQSLMKASENGKLPILCDMSPCLHHMKETLDKSLKLYEPIEFTLNFLKDKLEFTKQPGTIMVHAVCSAKKMGLESKLMELAKMCSEKAVIADVNCCGFAGDRGFTYPEMNEFGLRNLKKQIPAGVKEGYSTSRTCEIGLSLHGGISYKSILYLVDRVTTPKK
jgi:D-lactate dehydrogenase